MSGKCGHGFIAMPGTAQAPPSAPSTGGISKRNGKLWGSSLVFDFPKSLMFTRNIPVSAAFLQGEQ